MYRPNFCGECGEQIEFERRGRNLFWADRRFCQRCRKRFGAWHGASSWLWGAIFFCAAAALAYRAGRSAARSPPLVVERVTAAHVTSSSSSPRPPQDAPAADAGGAVGPASSEKTESATCGARTKKGKPCSRRVVAAGERCWQHTGKKAMRAAR